MTTPTLDRIAGALGLKLIETGGKRRRRAAPPRRTRRAGPAVEPPATAGAEVDPEPSTP